MLQGLGDYLQYIRYLAGYLSSVSSLAKGTSGSWRHKWTLETQVEPGDRGSANLNGSFKVLQGTPSFSKAVRGCLYFSKVLEQFIFLQGLGALESS